MILPRRDYSFIRAKKVHNISPRISNNLRNDLAHFDANKEDF